VTLTNLQLLFNCSINLLWKVNKGKNFYDDGSHNVVLYFNETKVYKFSMYIPLKSNCVCTDYIQSQRWCLYGNISSGTCLLHPSIYSGRLFYLVVKYFSYSTVRLIKISTYKLLGQLRKICDYWVSKQIWQINNIQNIRTKDCQLSMFLVYCIEKFLLIHIKCAPAYTAFFFFKQMFWKWKQSILPFNPSPYVHELILLWPTLIKKK
jgi:hypothetical protein